MLVFLIDSNSKKLFIVFGKHFGILVVVCQMWKLVLLSVERHDIPVVYIRVFSFHLHVQVFGDQGNRSGKRFKVSLMVINHSLVIIDLLQLLVKYQIVIASVSSS
jgi:hypothetical protein